MSDGLWFTDEQIQRELERGRFTGPTQEKIFRMRLLQDWQRLKAELEAAKAENTRLHASLDGHLKFAEDQMAELQQARGAACTWTYSEDWDGRIEWNGACGASWQFEDGGPVENEMSYCPTCGKRLVVLPTPPEQEANG